MIRIKSSDGVGAEVVATQESAKVGDIIKFGDYDWRVLDVRRGKALLLSDKIIERRAYHETWTGVTWADCTLRKYLNSEFYNSFNASDRVRIYTVTNVNPDNPEFGIYGGGDTTDKVFLLSLDEVMKYCNLGIRKADISWWLRSPGEFRDEANYVSDEGVVYVSGTDVGNNVYGIRPAMWITL